MVENSIQLQPTHATVVTDNTQLPKSQIAPKWQGNLPQMPSYQKKRHLITYGYIINHIFKIQIISHISLYSHKILSGGYAEYYHFIDEALVRLINFTRIPRDYWAHGIWIQVLWLWVHAFNH